MTRIQLDNGYIELDKDQNVPVDFAFNDIREGKTGNQSRVFEVPGTANNIEKLGYLFDVDVSSESFDRNKKEPCKLIQNDVVVFEGFLQLVEVIRVNDHDSTNQKSVKFQVNVFDDVVNFTMSMGEKELDELSFPELNHIFNRANIIASWSNTSGYTYPQPAKDDNIYTLRDFKPALYEYDVFQKIIKSNGYTFEFDQFDDDNIRMDKRILPFNGKELDDQIKQFLQSSYKIIGEDDAKSFTIDQTSQPTFPYGWLPMYDYLNGSAIDTYLTNIASGISLDTIIQDSQSQYISGDTIQNKAGNNRTLSFLTSYDYSVDVKAIDSGLSNIAWEVDGLVSQARCDIAISLVAQSITAPNKRVIIDAGTVIASFDSSGTYTFPSGYTTLGSGSNASAANLGLFDDDEQIQIGYIIAARYYDSLGNMIPNSTIYGNISSVDTSNTFVNVPCSFIDSSVGNDVRLCFDVDVTNLRIEVTPDIQELVKDSPVDMSVFVPRNVKQKDIIASVMASYNLVIVPDETDPKNLIFKTRDQYYSEGTVVDWTDKFAEDQENTLRAISNSSNKKHNYTYKEGKDVINTSYQDEVKEPFGTASLILDNEFVTDTKKTQVAYIPTPSILSGIGEVLPSLNGISPSDQLRVLLHNGVGTTSSYSFYDDITINSSELAYVTSYNKTSMFNDDIIPDFSICFDAPTYLFHDKQTGQTTNYLYNLHHKNELSTINQGDILKGYFWLNESDADKLKRRMNQKIYIKDNGYFVINKVTGYNANKETLTSVELIQIDENMLLKTPTRHKPVVGGRPVTDVVHDHNTNVANDTNIVLGNNVNVNGKYNVVVANDVYINGNQNEVKSSDVHISGNYNVVNTGLSGTKIFANNLEPVEADIYFNEIGFSQINNLASHTFTYFGAVGDGVTDDTAAIQAAVDSGVCGIDGECLTYFVSSEITVTNPIYIKNANFVIDGSYSDDQIFNCYGTIDSADTPTADLSEGDFSIPVTSGALYSEGDYLFVKDNGYWSPASLDDVKNGEVVRIKSISGNTLNLENSLISDYLSSNASSIQKINEINGVRFENINATGIDSNLKFARFQYCKNLTVRDGKTEEFDNAHYSVNTCIDYVFDNVKMDKTGVQDGLNYGIIHTAGCLNGKVINSYGANMRHLSSIGGSQGISRHIDVLYCTGYYMTDAGIDAHSAVLEHSFVGNNITISPEADTTQDGIISQGAQPFISGNKIFNARRHGINWQPLLSTSTTRRVKLTASDNEIDYDQSVTGTAYGILVVAPTNSTRKIDGVKLSGNRVTGNSIITSIVFIQAQANEIENIIISGNDFNSIPTSRGIHISSSGAEITNVTITGNPSVGGSAECIYLQGNSTYKIFNAMIGLNITDGGTYGFRANQVDYLNTVGNMYLNFATANRIITNVTNHIDLDT